MTESEKEPTNVASPYSEDEGEEREERDEERESNKALKGKEESITVGTGSDAQDRDIVIRNKEDVLGLQTPPVAVFDEKDSENVEPIKSKPNLDQKLSLDRNPSLDVEGEVPFKQGNWVLSEILVLLEAKEKEEESYHGEGKRNRVLADDKWKNISDYCRSKGVNRSKEQCKIKWDNMMPDFRKVRDYEEQKEGCNRSYFEMDVWEKRARILPSNMDVEVYQRIASILSNKPSLSSKGGFAGLKREAREKRLSNPSLPVGNALNVSGFEGVKPPLAELVGKHVMASSRKRRRRNKSVENERETVLDNMGFAPVVQGENTALKPNVQVNEKPESRDGSSTEDDATMMSCPSQNVHCMPSPKLLFAERSRLPASQTNEDNYAFSPPTLHHRSASPLPTLPLPSRNAVVNAGGGCQFDCVDDKDAHHHRHRVHDTRDGIGNNDMITLVEDRKDARHRDLIALEREKLVVFKEASYTIVNAMTNAIAMFSKVAEELIFRHP